VQDNNNVHIKKKQLGSIKFNSFLSFNLLILSFLPLSSELIHLAAN